jgi:addiction module HigA family antidote
MKIKYDKEADAAYIQMSSKKPDGGVELAEGVILHTTKSDEIVAIEILDATRKIPIKTLYKLELVNLPYSEKERTMRYLKNIHPGEVLKEEFLDPMGISVYRLSKETGLSQTRLSQIIKGKRSVTAETAIKIGKFFGVAAEFWMNLQSLYDIEEAKKQYRKEIKSIHVLKKAIA